MDMKVYRYMLHCLICLMLSGCMVGIDPLETPVTPIAPTIVAAQPGNAKAYVAWAAIENITDYHLYKTASIEPDVLITIDMDSVQTLGEFTALFDSLGISYSSVDVENTTYEDEDLSNGKGYCYGVTGVSGEEGPLSNMDCTIPMGVAVPSAVAVSLAVTVNWDAVGDAESYNVYWKEEDLGASPSISKAADMTGYELIANVESTGADAYSYAHTGRSNCTDDYYIIKPINVLGQESEDGQETYGQPRTIGQFNEDFGTAGIIMRTDVEGDFIDIEFLSDGSIVALFNARAPGRNMIYKFDADGTYVDVVDVDDDLHNDVNALTVDENDNVYAISEDPLNVCSYSSELEPVSAFGVSGCFKSGVTDSYGNDIVMDSSGRVLVTGRGDDVTSEALTVWRLTAEGSLDTTFDSDGVYTYHDYAPPTTEGTGLVILDGVIYATGYYTMAFPPQLFVIALNESDGSYIGDATDAGQGGTTTGSDIIVNTDGSLLITGTSGAVSSIYLWNYDTDFTLLSSHAFSLYAGADPSGSGNSILMDCIGNPIVAGSDGNIITTDLATIRLHPDFSLDDMFGNQDPVDGWFVYDEAGERDVARRVIEDNYGRLFISGSVRNAFGQLRPVIFGLK
jgi:hypothetical protein